MVIYSPHYDDKSNYHWISWAFLHAYLVQHWSILLEIHSKVCPCHVSISWAGYRTAGKKETLTREGNCDTRNLTSFLLDIVKDDVLLCVCGDSYFFVIIVTCLLSWLVGQTCASQQSALSLDRYLRGAVVSLIENLMYSFVGLSPLHYFLHRSKPLVQLCRCWRV